MSFRVYVQYAFNSDRYAVHLAKVEPDRTDVVEPIDLVFSEVDVEGVETPPAFHIPTEMARALYDALGHALGIHTPDARLAAEVLAREQVRVDKMLDHLTGSVEASK